MKTTLLILAASAISIFSFAQNHQFQCGSQPTKSELKQIDELSANWTKSANEDDTLVIPVVVHIIHKGTPVGSGANIDDEQVYSAINALNMHYTGFDENYCDRSFSSKIRFRLAEIDPSGNPHSGINRVNGAGLSAEYADYGVSIASSGLGESSNTVKSWSIWPYEEYENIWIVAEINGNNGGAGIQGYANYPSPYNQYQGTVQLFNAFGTEGFLKSYTSQNKTTTHELGHRLNLLHTHEGDACSEVNCNVQGDRVCDTPPTTEENSCGTPVCDLSTPTDNFMSYLYQSCRDKFADGQIDRMRNTIVNTYSSLMGNEPYQNDPQSLEFLELEATEDQGCNGLINSTVTFRNNSPNRLYNASISYGIEGESAEVFNWWGLLKQGQEVSFCLPTYQSEQSANGEFYAEALGDDIITSVSSGCSPSLYDVELNIENYCQDEIQIEVNGDLGTYQASNGLIALQLPAGNNELEISPEGYLAETININVNSNESVDLTLEPGDTNGDNSVNASDLSEFINTYGLTSGQFDYNPICDFNCDGIVNAFDLALFIENYGSISTIYPNPFQNYLFVLHKGSYELEFISRGGNKTVISGKGPGRISVDEIPKGFYFVRVKTRAGTYVQRLIKSGY